MVFAGCFVVGVLFCFVVFVISFCGVWGWVVGFVFEFAFEFDLVWYCL